jgi:hypothetical protein
VRDYPESDNQLTPYTSHVQGVNVLLNWLQVGLVLPNGREESENLAVYNWLTLTYNITKRCEFKAFLPGGQVSTQGQGM